FSSTTSYRFGLDDSASPSRSGKPSLSRPYVLWSGGNEFPDDVCHVESRTVICVTGLRFAAASPLPREAQPRPRPIDRAYFVVHPVLCQAEFPYHIVGEITPHAGRLLWPCNPHWRSFRQSFRQRTKITG